MDLIKKVLRIENHYGEIVDIRQPSILMQEELRARLLDFFKLLESHSLDKMTFAQAYNSSKKFKRFVKQIMEIVGVEADEIPADYLAQLLLTHETVDEEGNKQIATQGELITFIFGAPQEAPEKIPTEDIDIVAKLWGELWAVTEDFNEAMDILKTVSHADLSKILEYRGEAMMSAEERTKKTQQDASRKLMEKLQSGEVKLKDDAGTELSDSETDNILKDML